MSTSVSLTAKDVMNGSVRGVHESATLREAVALLAHHQLSGLPVIDSSGALRGVVSQYDVLVAYEDPSALDLPVTAAMSPHSLTISEHAPLEAIAELFRTRRIQRAPVVDGPTVVGIVSRTDLVRHLAESV